MAVCLEPAFLRYLDPVARLAADEGKAVRVPIDPIGLPLPNAREEEFEGFVVRSLVFGQEHELGLAVKRARGHRRLRCVGLVVLSPLLLATALAIRLRDGSPVLFRQTRVGLHGRPFTICKFRTMVPDAEERYAEVAGTLDDEGRSPSRCSTIRASRPLGRLPAADEPRRAAPAVERAEGRHEPGRPPTAPRHARWPSTTSGTAGA